MMNGNGMEVFWSRIEDCNTFGENVLETKYVVADRVTDRRWRTAHIHI